MDLQILRIFQAEVARQCRFALLAHADLIQALASADSDRLWYAAQGLVIAAGNISKLLWPKHLQRRQELRDSLGVSANWPHGLHDFRRLRNHFEHFDERLEDWATASGRRDFIDSNVSDTRSPFAEFDVKDFLRNFDTTDHALTFQGETYHLRPIMEAVKALHAAAAREASRPLSE